MAPSPDSSRCRTRADAVWPGGPGGEMGELVASMDWASTPLGSQEAWPTSLKTTVGVVLQSAFPMLLWWGDELIQIYNDAYRPILGEKHPESMGAPGAEVWSEIWDILGPLAEQVRSGAGATWHEDLLLPMNRKGFVEETYFTFSYSPVPADDGSIGGVLVTCQETTSEVQDARQFRTLRDLGARSAYTRSAEEACRAAAAAFFENDADVPFALLYLLCERGESARLVESIRLSDYEGPGKSREIALDHGDVWGLAEAHRTHAPVEIRDLRSRLGAMPGGCWEEAPERAIVIPLSRSAQAAPQGFLVCGLSSRRVYDARYAGFFRLAADQIGGAITSARARQEDRRRADELAKLDRAKTAFFNNISHEFRTPLTLILGPLEEVRRSGRPASGAELETIHRNALRLLKLVNALLGFARMESGRMAPRYEPTDLGFWTAEIASGFRSAIESAGLRYEVRCDPLPEHAYVDRGMWETIVSNLLSNALKFTFEGAVEVALRASASDFVLDVRDTGIGIPEAERPQLFERFHQVQGARARTHEGAGIGLALAREFARLHGGDIEVDSAERRGSVFRVRIPRGRAHLPADQNVDSPSSTAPPGPVTPIGEVPASIDDVSSAPSEWTSAAAASQAPDSAPERAPGRVLVADDNADMRRYLERLLRRHWSVELAENGAVALAAARESPPDVALIDVMMPAMDGFEVLQALRADPRTRLVPVVMLSARAGEEARTLGIEAGAEDYLVKPFSTRELLARVSTHLELGRLRWRLERERAAFEELFEQAPLPIAVLRGDDLVFDLANPAYRRVVGRDVVGKPLLEAMPELAGQEFDTLLRDVIATGSPHVRQEALVRLERTESGKVEDTYFTFIYAPIAGRGDQGPSVAVICNEVTEQVRARKQMEHLAEKAEEANRAKDEFLAMLGHELRNPLSPILTALQLVRMRGLETREHAIIERQVDHLVRLVDDLLDVSRIIRGKIDIKKTRIEIGDIVRRALETTEPLLEKGAHRVELRVPPRGLGVEVDPHRMSQVIANLLTNAAKYSEHGSRIEIEAARRGESVHVWVKDEGVGLAPEEIDRVFQLFHQQRQATDRFSGGLGLGLTIAHSLVELHGGRIRAESEGRGRGSTFEVELPWVDLETDPERAESDASVQTPGEVRRVLVVDDNEDAADTLAGAVKVLGHEVEVAYGGPEALESASRLEPDTALVDIGLPVMDGHELGRRLRERNPGIRLIAVTGYGRDIDRERSREAGFEAHLVKPLSLEAVMRAIADNPPSSPSPEPSS